MQEKPPARKDKELWIRRVLKTPAPYVVAGASITGAVMALYHNPSEVSFAESGDTSHPIDQKEVNTYYTNLFDLLEKKKEQAAKESKKLAVVIAEDHSRPDAFIVECMIIDICKRLGIPLIGSEVPDKAVDDMKKLTQMAGLIENSLLAHHQKDIPELKKDEDCFSILRNAELLSAVIPSNDYNLINALAVAEFSGLKTFAADPLNEMLEKGDSAEINAHREQAMKERLALQTGDYAVIFGATHTPVVTESLEKSGYLVCLVDASNDQIEPKRLAHNDRLLLENFLKRRDIAVVINGKAVASNAEAYMRAMIASLHHQKKEIVLHSATYGDISLENYMEKQFPTYARPASQRMDEFLSPKPSRSGP